MGLGSGPHQVAAAQMTQLWLDVDPQESSHALGLGDHKHRLAELAAISSLKGMELVDADVQTISHGREAQPPLLPGLTKDLAELLQLRDGFRSAVMSGIRHRVGSIRGTSRSRTSVYRLAGPGRAAKTEIRLSGACLPSFGALEAGVKT